MAKDSDIIKIGFDYRASLEQFEKETNGVFDGISAKADKQRISIQLDAKNDKVIEKIKELQKLKLDKFTFEFGESGLAEQLKTFDQLEKKINEIINLSKGITSAISKTDFGTKNKTEAYNQLKQMADIFKNFYGNEEAMHSKAGTDAAYAYYKAYEEALKKGIAESKLQKVTVDVDPTDSFFTAEKLVYDRMQQYDSKLHYGGTTDLSEELLSLESRLSKFDEAYSKVRTNLGNAPITPEILKNIEEYVRYLEIAEAREKDRDLIGFSQDDIDSMKDMANMNLGFAMTDAIEENKKYVSSLDEVREEKEKTDEVLNHPSTSAINDSQFDELKADVVEIREELNGVKEKISVIDSDGFENIKSDVEKTTESVKELNSELTELKSKVGDKSNISSGNVNEIIDSQNKIQEELEKTSVKAQKAKDSLIEVYRGVQIKGTNGISNRKKNDSIWADAAVTFASSSPDVAALYQIIRDQFSEQEIKLGDGEILKEIISLQNALSFDNYGKSFEEITYWGDATDEAGKKAKTTYESLLAILREFQDTYGVLITENAQLYEDNWGNSKYNFLQDGTGFGFSDAKELAKSLSEEKSLIPEFVELIQSYMDTKMSLDSQLETNPMFGKHHIEEFAKMAEQAGYSVVEIKNVIDTYDQLPEDIATDYIIIDPSAIKSVEQYTGTLSKLTQERLKLAEQGKETNVSSTIEDVFQNEKVEQATTSAKELDKTLEQVNIPTDSFDDVLSKLDLTKSKLTEIVKITRQARADKDGKFYESFTLTDKNGSHETYGENSKTDRGQLLEAKYVEFDAKSADQETKTIKEAYEYNQKLDSVLSETKDKLNGLKFPSDISNEYKNLIDYSEELQHQLKNCEISVEQYSKKMDTAIQKFDKLSQSTFASKEQDSHNYWQGRFSDSIKDLSGENKNSALDDMRKYYQDLEKESAKVSEQEAKEIQKVWEDNLKAITDYMDAKTELNSLEASDKKSNKKSNEIADLTQEVEKAKVKAEEARIALSSMVNPNNVDIDTWDKWLKMMEDFRQAGDGSSKSIAKLKDAIANVNTSELQTIDKYIESAQKKLDSTKSGRPLDQQSTAFKSYIDEVSGYIKEIEAEKKRLDDALTSGDIELISEENLSRITDLKKKIDDANLSYKTLFKGSSENSRRKEIDTISKQLAKNSKYSQEAKDKLNGFIDTLKNGGADVDVNKIHIEFLKVIEDERIAGREGQNFIDILKSKAVGNFAAQLVGYYLGWTDFIQYAKQAVDVVIELDTALVDLKKTTAMTSSQMEDFYFEANDVAKEMGTTTTAIIEQASAWSRLGYNTKEAATEMAKLSSKFATISPGMDTDTAQEGLVSIMKAWDIGYEDVESEILDKINILGKFIAQTYSNVWCCY